MKKIFMILAAFGMLIFFSGCAKVLATVNGQPVTQKELDRELELANGKPALEALVSKKLVEQDAAAKKITVSTAEIDKQMDEVKKNIPPANQKTLTPDRMQLLRDQIRFNILLRKTILYNVPENNIKNYYDKNKDILPEVELSDIVVANPQQAKAIVDELNRGKDFSDMAKQFSLDTATRDRGGYAGFASRGNLMRVDPHLAEAAFSVNPGAISPVIKTRRGFYILKVASKKETFDQLRDDVERMMAGDRARSYMEDLRNKAKIDYKGEYAKS